MSDQTDYFRAMQAHHQEEHAQQKVVNLSIIQQSGLSYKSTNNGECLCFRESGRPKVDFYPSSGRWRDVGPNKRIYKRWSARVSALVW